MRPERTAAATDGQSGPRRGGLVPAAFVLIAGLAGVVGWYALHDGDGAVPVAYLDLAPEKKAGAPQPETLTLSPPPPPEVPPPEAAPAETPADDLAQTTGPGAVGGQEAGASLPSQASAPETGAPPPLALAPAPDPALVEATEAGALPRIGADGRTPFATYRRPSAVPADRPRVAIVLAGLGLRDGLTRAAIRDLPPDVSLAFTPYARDLDGWAANARGAGHELLLQVPMEPALYPADDPGPQTLLTTLGRADNMKRLLWSLSRMPGYVGIVPMMGARFTGDEAALRPVIAVLAERGLMFLDNRAAANPAGPRIAAAAGAPRASVALAIDARPSRAAIDQRLAELERAALSGGSAIGFAPEGLPVTVEAVAAWARGLPERGVALVPVSALAEGAPAR